MFISDDARCNISDAIISKPDGLINKLNELRVKVSKETVVLCQWG